MRNAALTLGIIAGIIGMIVGFFGYGYTELANRHAEVTEVFGMFERPELVRVMSILAPCNPIIRYLCCASMMW